jgi:hypothetical protein
MHLAHGAQTEKDVDAELQATASGTRNPAAGRQRAATFFLSPECPLNVRVGANSPYL